MPEHGKYSTYNNHKCHCEPCTAAATAYMQKYRQTENGRVATRRANRVTAKASRLAAAYLKKNEPHIWNEIQRQAREEIKD